MNRNNSVVSSPSSSYTPKDAGGLLRAHGETVANYLQSLKTRYPQAPAKLVEAIDYSLLAGGKRIRPALVLETANACTSGAAEQVRRSAIAAAGAIELIHTFSLVHDDLPAMDDDALRRGRPTSHKVFGEAMAILAGDAMVTLAFQVLATDAHPSVAAALVAELAIASGPAGMIGGQVLDMESENQALNMEQLQQVHRMKTGALLSCACRLGAIAGRAGVALPMDLEAALRPVSEFGRHLGLAFQIVDDILDISSTPEQLGKATNKDAGRGKNTYPGLIGADASQAEADRQSAAALDALVPLGAAADGLRTLARFVVDRSS